MTVAYLVLACNAPKTLAASVKVYRHSGGEVFVHLDSKIDFDKFISMMGEAALDCKFIADRYSIYWAGFSMIEATLSLIRAAKTCSSFSRYVLISDDTAPIRSPSSLVETLASSNEFISVRSISSTDPFAKRYQNFYFFDHPATALRGRPIESSAIDTRIFSVIEEIKMLMMMGKENVNLFYGSQWWALTHSAVEYIQEVHSSNDRLRNSFRFTAVPDEMYFQTILMSSTFRGAVRGSLVCVDWSKQIRPHIFTSMEEILSQASPSELFARKIDEKNLDLRNSILSIQDL